MNKLFEIMEFLMPVALSILFTYLIYISAQ